MEHWSKKHTWCDKAFQVASVDHGRNRSRRGVSDPPQFGRTFLAADALVLKVREAGHVVGVHTLIATGTSAPRATGSLGIQVTSAEDGAGWLAFFRDLVARGPVRGRAGHQRRPSRRPGGRDQPPCPQRPGMQGPLRSQSDGSREEAPPLAMGAHPAALHLRPARRQTVAQYDRVLDDRQTPRGGPSASTPPICTSTCPATASQEDLAPDLIQQPQNASAGGATPNRRRGPSPTAPRSIHSSGAVLAEQRRMDPKDGATWASRSSPEPEQH